MIDWSASVPKRFMREPLWLRPWCFAREPGVPTICRFVMHRLYEQRPIHRPRRPRRGVITGSRIVQQPIWLNRVKQDQKRRRVS